MSRRRTSVKSTTKSLDATRKLLQSSINEEIHLILQKYIETYFIPATGNIESNQQTGVMPKNGMPPKQYIRTLCKDILNEAKKMY